MFILDPMDEAPGGIAHGAASRWWLHHSLISLSNSYRELGHTLEVHRGDSFETLCEIATRHRASAVHVHRRYLPAYDERDDHVAARLTGLGLDFRSFPSYLLHDPDLVRTGAGTHYRVFTPFWKRFLTEHTPRAPLGVPGGLLATQPLPRPAEGFQSVVTLDLLPDVRWDSAFYDHWTPGPQSAIRRLNAFRTKAIHAYAEERDRIDNIYGTSELSAHLHFGELTAAQVWHMVHAAAKSRGLSSGEKAYLRQLGWREFAWHVLIHEPQTVHEPLRGKYKAFPWRRDNDELRRWQRGRTGYPIVDAGMRQLWTTGWMHNRVRMITSSFLTKHLLHSWTDGAAWFADTLVDADLANNTLGWQWAAGCGADAQPYFRIFHPVTQGRKFDPEGYYVREWIPELRGLPTEYIHAPWEAPEDVLEAAGVSLGTTYPEPVVDHREARERALAALTTVT